MATADESKSDSGALEEKAPLFLEHDPVKCPVSLVEFLEHAAESVDLGLSHGETDEAKCAEEKRSLLQNLKKLANRRDYDTVRCDWAHGMPAISERIKAAFETVKKGLHIIISADLSVATFETYNEMLSQVYDCVDALTANAFGGTFDGRVAVINTADSRRTLPRFEHVVLGGTFDRLHSGHKILLSAAVWLLSDSGSLTVGLSADELLVRKRFASELQTWDQRRAAVESFCEWLAENSGLKMGALGVERLRDCFGPSVASRMQALVASRETEAGAEAVNAERRRLGHESLKIFLVGLQTPVEGCAKLSSSSIRQWISNRSFLQQNWRAMCRSVATGMCVHCVEALTTDWFEVVCAMYSECQCHYHTLSHVFWILCEWQRAYHRHASDPLAVLLSVWFHDVAEAPQRSAGRNEVLSAAVFQLFAAHFSAASVLNTEKVTRYILATIKHGIADDFDADLAIFLDLDLGILAADWSQYEDYSRKIRKEYHFVASLEFAERRAAVLRRFLERDPIYFCREIKALSALSAEKEAKARDNLQREIKALEATKKAT